MSIGRLSTGSDLASPRARAVLAVLALLLVSATLFRGGLPPLALMALEFLGLVLIGLVLWDPPRGISDGVERLFLVLLVLGPLLYLVPLPSGAPAWLTGQGLYSESIVMVAGDAVAPPRPLSIVPLASEAAWLVLMVPLGVYLATRMLGETARMRLVYLLFGVASAQAILAAFQFAAAQSGVEYPFVDLFDRTGASGTFANRNHLAGLLEMSLPLVLALFLHDFGHRHADTRERLPRGWRGNLIAIGREGGRPSVVLGVLGVLFILGIVFTRSRSGLVLAMLGILATATLFSRRVGGRDSFGLTGQLATVATAFALVLGLAPVLDRFTTDGVMSDARWPLAEATFDAAGALLPFGGGPGTFTDVFRYFQPLDLGRWFIAHAHNDYLESLFELGVFAPIMALGFLILYLRQWSRLWTRDDWPRMRFLQIGAGIGIVLMMLHSLLDYNLRTPANLVYFAFIAGLFFSDPSRAPLIRKKRRKLRHTVYLEATELAPQNRDVETGPRPARQIPNPFLD